MLLSLFGPESRGDPDPVEFPILLTLGSSRAWQHRAGGLPTGVNWRQGIDCLKAQGWKLHR